mmetsp:Transcript_13357/g.19905  ORF Transcript_13357/g.19905 Transcript_13357/m.19905 type:complete len:338 (-) Transcript_13357:60-1073(-)
MKPSKPIQPTHRQCIRKQSPANNRISPQWKESLKKKCLERARQKRNRQITTRRRTPNPADTTPSPNGYDVRRIPLQSLSSKEGSNSNSTRELIQEQLQASGVSIVPGVTVAGMGASSTPTTTTTIVSSNLMFQTPPIGTSHNAYNKAPERGYEIDVRYIQEDELVALMEEIEEEIQAEMRMIQEQETLEQSILEDQIQREYEEYNSTHNHHHHHLPQHINLGDVCLENSANNGSNTAAEMPCPLCQVGTLRTSTSVNQFSSIFYCTGNCKLTNGAQFSTGITLEHLKEKLINAYEEHSNLCTGVLQFDINELDGRFGLVTGCLQCRRRAMITLSKAC